MLLSAGHALPLGASWDGAGVNFALWSSCALRVELCLFDSPGAEVETTRVSLPARTGDVWHGYAPDVRPGQLYGYRVHGPWEPALGHRCNASELLFDPYARAAGAPHSWNAGHPPMAAVVDDTFDWGRDRPPRTPFADSVLYELHVKGFTALHRGVPAGDRGTYRGVADEAAISHLRRLGITAVELMPIHFRVDERALHQRGLSNYWGYNTLGFFAPDPRLAASRNPQEVIREFKSMVKALHAAGLEVILDVVYNHTAEGDHLGPTLSMRGIDNAAYYRLRGNDRSLYQDFTGCGNTLDTRSAVVRQLILDSLRYWVHDMHIDGFRFDLASALVRNDAEVDLPSPLLEAIARDPLLSQVKLIAEPWDATADGYLAGRFPVGWSEWNGRFRDSVRRVWRGDAGHRGELATRLSGSSDLFAESGRSPQASINFVTAHDGFTLADLVSYERKHNDANGEANADGEAHNASANWGVEGPTDDAAIQEVRARVKRSLLLTLAVSQGVPMISGGDELGRTQRGNNNAYCHDSPLSWTPWPGDTALLAFLERALALRRANPLLRRPSFLRSSDVTWLTASGTPLEARDWQDAEARSLGMWVRSQGETPSFLILLNPDHQAAHFTLPATPGAAWTVTLSSADPDASPYGVSSHAPVVVPAHAVVALQSVTDG